MNTSINNLILQWNELKNSANSCINSQNFEPVHLTGLHGSSFAFFLSQLSNSNHFRNLSKSQYEQNYSLNTNSDLLIVVPSEYEANIVYTDISSVFPQVECYVFPWWGTIPYRPVAKGSSVFGKRAGILSKLLHKNKTVNFENHTRIFIVTQRSFISPLPKPEYLKDFSFKLKKGDVLDTVKISDKLSKLGYTRVSKVTVRGEFSLRGEVLDIFVPCDENASRVIFDFDTIEKIKSFDATNQATIDTKEEVFVHPLKEIIWTDELVSIAEKKLQEYDESSISEDKDFEINANNFTSDDKWYSAHLAFTEEAKKYSEKMLLELSVSGESEGEEFLYQLLWDKRYSFIDYLDNQTFVVFYDFDRMKNALQAINREYIGMYRKARYQLPVLPPDLVNFDFDNLLENVSRCIQIHTILQEEDTYIKLPIEASRSFFGNINYLKEELTNLQKENWNIFIYADNENQLLRINQIIKDFTDETLENPVKLIPKQISVGFIIPEIKVFVIQENEIFGRRKYNLKTTNRAKSQAIDTFVELNPGDYVVHVDWGIGLFHGIERIKAGGNERDYIKLEYADNEMAFVPIEQVNFVQRYIGNEGEKPKIDRIGSKSWENRKNKVKKAVEDLAQRLIDLYSRRQASVGYAFPKETEWQAAFEAAFPYEDTPDQITVTEEVKSDMEKPVPMDRLVCGDVGYGKTEIAMRSAFKAVMGGKQVAFLAPTTILAEQHYENCVERFKNFPVKIAHLSRFVTPAEQKKVLAKLAEGQVDVLVGTHRIIQKDVKYKNLGLMIIDEEQRFGVKDKEKLKEIKNNIDCLTMSATPIPRTLHMSLLKIRDMSLLTTPPQNRHPIETVIDEYTDDRVANAIRQEIDRGGQVFYLHNRVESLPEVRRKIETIVPEVLVDVAHGQMTSTQLDDIFHRFKMGGFHVLIATTIIENGIDIPNVNTIIIDRADMYGVSQLYQLRGRVGRSDKKAYAYLLYPENKALSEVAMKRLQVISDFTELGSGFKIAMKDMEIRGAGNLLGRDQSGDVYAVGFDLYVRLLNDAVHNLMAQKDYQETVTEVLMDLEYTGFIPETYVQNPQTKMEIYKKIAAITTDNEFENVVFELEDRFGPIPEEVSSLLALAEIRIICKKLSISAIRERKGEAKIEFAQRSNLSIDKLLLLIKNNPNVVRLDPSLPNVLFIKIGQIGLKEKSEFIREKLSSLLNSK